MRTNLACDVAVVGGGPAGLAAATTLGRSLRSVVVIDSGEPRNAVSPAAHNVLTRDGIGPEELRSIGRQEAQQYGVDFVAGAVRTVSGSVDARFRLEAADGSGRQTTVTARRVLLATGLVDELPGLPGLAEAWGRTVLHCPYCHGWEVRGRRIGVLATSPRSLHQALLFRQLSPEITYFAGDEGLSGVDRETLAARDIGVVEGMVDRFVGTLGTAELVLRDGRSFSLDALVVAPRFVARGDLYQQLGGSLTELPGGFGAATIATEPGGRTAIPGVFAAGNNHDLSAMIMAAAGEGVATAAMINADLVAEDTATAVAQRRDPFSAAAEAANCERLFGGRRHGLDAVAAGTPGSPDASSGNAGDAPGFRA